MGEKACLSTETHSRKGDSSFSSTWFSRLPWSPASLRNLHPYCHLRMSLSSLTEWATGISTTMMKAITDILRPWRSVCHTVDRHEFQDSCSAGWPRAILGGKPGLNVKMLLKFTFCKFRRLLVRGLSH